MHDCDIAVVGAGHNALVSAAYLAKAGYRVEVFERRDVVGGAVSTVEQVPGYRFDLGGSAHILIRMTPIPEELGLADHGLEYIELDPIFYAPGLDGPSFYIYRDLDRTVEHLNGIFPGEGDNYRRFCTDWRDFSLTVRDAFLSTPSPLQLGRRMLFGGGTTLPWKEALRQIMRPYGDVVDSYFSAPRLKAALIWMAAQSGPPPTEPLSGPFALWHPLYHEGGIARPRGGSGMLSVALQRCIEAHGGRVHTGCAVEEILVEQGRVRGIRHAEGICRSRGVLSGAHAAITYGKLLPPEHRPVQPEALRTGNGFGAVLRLALDAPVEYQMASDQQSARTALQLLCERPEEVLRAYGTYLQGEPTRRPPIVSMTFSAVDETLAPSGGEVLWLWAQYFPYALGGGASWDEIAPAVRCEILDQFERYAPGTREKIVGELFQHPLWLERNLYLPRGNVMHLEMSIDQMFGLRPALGESGYRSSLPGLYLTGASTHPGGGIMGASGRNAARVLLSDLQSRLFRSPRLPR